MKMSIATVCPSGDLNEKLQAIAAAGFRGVEIFESDLLTYNGTPTDVAKEMADLGLKVITFQPFRDFEAMPEPQRVRIFDRAERKFDLMQEIDCDLALIYLMDYLREKGGAATLDVPAMLPRSKCLGAEFIEFAVDDRMADELTCFLSGFGFQNVSRHKSKAVTRGSQGSIRI